MILFLRTDRSLSTYMMYGSIFTVHGRDGTDGRHLNLLILVRIAMGSRAPSGVTMAATANSLPLRVDSLPHGRFS